MLKSRTINTLQSSCDSVPEATAHAVACEHTVHFSRPSQMEEPGSKGLKRQGDISQASASL